MGVQRTTDFLEKSTWTLAIALLICSLLSSMIVPRTEVADDELNRSKIEEQIQNAPQPYNPQQQGVPLEEDVE